MTRVLCKFIVVFVCLLALPTLVFGQGGYNDDRVMIQGFMWESHQDPWPRKWYDHVKGKVGELADAKFDLIWLPPPSKGEGAGYHPHELNEFDNNYGNEQQHRSLLHALLAKGIEPIADVVINHRNGSGGWATFKNPTWPSTFICSDDEFWFQSPSSLPNQKDREILAAGNKGAPDFQWSNYPKWHGARDLDHTNSEVRKEIKKYLRKLRAFGYRGWRYDMVKGFAAGYIAEYNYDSQPTFAVGEYWDGNENVLTPWVDGTKFYGQPDPAKRACSAFDFATYERLKEFINGGKYDHLPAVHFKDGTLDGFIAINKDKSVTFLENHDTGWPQKKFDSFGRNDKLTQGYAYILTHPGLPCVYWKHYFEWAEFGPKIKDLVKARKYAGVHSGSYIKSEVHGNDYVAIVGDKPSETSTLIVKIGPGLEFNPDGNIWGLETSGNGYAVWVRKSKKAETKDKVDSPKPPHPIPGG